MFERLRDEIVNDEMLAGQPESSKKWVKEVRQEGESKHGNRCRGGLGTVQGAVLMCRLTSTECSWNCSSIHR